MIDPLRTAVVQKHFVIDAHQQRVWELLGSAVFQCLPLEEMNILNQTTFYAVLRWRLGFISIPLNLKVKLVDILAPHSLGSVIWVTRGIIQLGLRATFTLRPVNEAKTEVICSATEEGKESIMGRIMRRWERSFAEEVFNSIRVRLEKVC